MPNEFQQSSKIQTFRKTPLMLVFLFVFLSLLDDFLKVLSVRFIFFSDYITVSRGIYIFLGYRLLVTPTEHYTIGWLDDPIFETQMSSFESNYTQNKYFSRIQFWNCKLWSSTCPLRMSNSRALAWALSNQPTITLGEWTVWSQNHGKQNNQHWITAFQPRATYWIKNRAAPDRPEIYVLLADCSLTSSISNLISFNFASKFLRIRGAYDGEIVEKECRSRESGITPIYSVFHKGKYNWFHIFIVCFLSRSLNLHIANVRGSTGKRVIS